MYCVLWCDTNYNYFDWRIPQEFTSFNPLFTKLLLHSDDITTWHLNIRLSGTTSNDLHTQSWVLNFCVVLFMNGSMAKCLFFPCDCLELWGWAAKQSYFATRVKSPFFEQLLWVYMDLFVLMFHRWFASSFSFLNFLLTFLFIQNQLQIRSFKESCMDYLFEDTFYA